MTARVTGETEHLEQIVKDMEEAGPGATGSRTYRAIVAELARREEEAPGAAATDTGGDENQSTQVIEGTDSVNTLPSTLRPDDFLVSEVDRRSVNDTLIEGECGLDIHLEYNVQADQAGEIEAAYYSLMLTPHGGHSPNAMLLLSPQKIPTLIEALRELHDAWQQDIKRTTLAGITASDIVIDAQARGMKATDVLKEMLAQLGIDDGKAV